MIFFYILINRLYNNDIVIYISIINQKSILLKKVFHITYFIQIV